MTEDYDLTKSSKALGKLYPILKDAHGNIIDGFHRKRVNPVSIPYKAFTKEETNRVFNLISEEVKA